MTVSVTLDALRVTQAAGLRLRLLPEPGQARVECPACGFTMDVDMAKWVALPAKERGCVPRSVGRCGT